LCWEGWGVQIPSVRTSPLLVVLVLLAGAAGCTDQMPGQVCTALFAYIQVAVQSKTGQPIQGLSISDSVLRTGAVFTVPQSGVPNAPGSYVVLDDNFRNQLRTSGDSVRVTGYEGGEVFSTLYVFDVPDGCHVQKVSGPDTVTP